MDTPRVTLALRGPLVAADVAGLCKRLRALADSDGVRVILCDVAGVVADAVLVDALARLQLEARRCGCEVRLDHAGTDLIELIALMGLGDVLRPV